MHVSPHAFPSLQILQQPPGPVLSPHAEIRGVEAVTSTIGAMRISRHTRLNLKINFGLIRSSSKMLNSQIHLAPLGGA